MMLITNGKYVKCDLSTPKHIIGHIGRMSLQVHPERTNKTIGAGP